MLLAEWRELLAPIRSSRVGFTVGLLSSLAFLAAFQPKAYTARHPDYAKKTFVIRGAPAREVVSFLGLRLDQPWKLELELPETMEHFSHPELDEQRRNREGFLEDHPERKSALLHNSIAWNPATGVLTLGEHWFDSRTGIPASEGPAFFASSPQFAETDRSQVKGWELLLRQLQPLAVRREAWGERRAREFVFGKELWLRFELLRLTWTGKLMLSMRAGPW
mgnify:CR=1 FL=1